MLYPAFSAKAAQFSPAPMSLPMNPQWMMVAGWPMGGVHWFGEL
jgi:hypothetical protein